MSNTVNNYTETDLGNISLNPRGEYDNSAAYEYLDTVSYRGGSYFCLAELETMITGIAPDAGRNSEHWQMIATPGDMTPEYTAAYNDVINKAVQVEISRAAVELAQQEIEAVQTDVQQLHSDTVQMAQQAENSKNSAANFAQSAEQSRKTVSESEQNIKGQIAGFDSRVSEAVEQSKEEINTTKQQAINTITNQQTTSVNTVKTEGEKIITRVGNDAKTVADDRATVEEAAQTVLNNAQEVARNAQTVAGNTENAAASAEGAKTSADNAAQSAKGVEDASKQIEQNKKDVASLKEDLSNKITKFYASNQGETHITDSDNGKIMDMMLYGKSEQKQYSGKNLLNLRNGLSGTGGGVNYTRNDDGSYFRTGTATDATGNVWFAGSYGPIANIQVLFTLKPGNYKVKDCVIFSGMTSLADTFAIETDLPVTGIRNPGLIVGVTYRDTIYPILTSDTDTGWEPYTGGQPSPSPDYPQAIKSVVNPTVNVIRKNLWSGKNTEHYWNGNNVTVNTECISSDYIPIKGSQTIYAGFSYDWFIGFNCYDSKKNKILGSEQQLNSTQENIEQEYRIVPSNAKTPENTAFIKIMFSKHESKPYVSIVEGKYEPYHEQNVTLPYTLNAIPVSSGGNITIDGQRYIADYVDVERGKLVRMIGVANQDAFVTSKWESTGSIVIFSTISNVGNDNAIVTISSEFTSDWSAGDEIHHFTQPIGQTLVIVLPKTITTIEQGEEIRAKGFEFYYKLATPIEIDLTEEEITALKELTTYYPTTNISVNSEQLDGYTVFNYPISMKNGWDYVKKQLNDNRDYIYDMDLQSAEAYVNSEYAVALTELEV